MTDNPFYRHFPETTGPQYGDGLPLTARELDRRYSSGRFVGAITVDGVDLPWYARKAAAWELDSFVAEVPNANYEDSPEFLRHRAEPMGEDDYWLPWKDYLYQHPSKAMKGRQRTGDCTSWMVRLMVQLTRMQRLAMGEQELYRERTATCAYYAARGHNGQGSNPTRQARYAATVGHVFEIVYGRFDLRDYDSYFRLGMGWGRSGLPSEISEITSKYAVGQPHRIRTTEGLLDAMRKRYPCGLGSSLGATSRGNPMSRISGSWNHAMDLPGYDNRPSIREQLGLRSAMVAFDQSWGNWSTITNAPESWKPLPQGIFFLELNDIRRYIERGECLCYIPTEATGVPVVGEHPFLEV